MGTNPIGALAVEAADLDATGEDLKKFDCFMFYIISSMPCTCELLGLIEKTINSFVNLA